MAKKTLFILFITFSTLLLGACGSSSSDENSNPARNYIGTQAPGDLWSWAITTGPGGTGTFTASNDTLGYTYSGDIENLTNGFLKLTITATTEPGLTLTPPVIAYALEFPDTALVIKPDGTTGNVIVAAARGSCPTVNATYNWVNLLVTGWDPVAGQAYGVSDSTITTGAVFTFSNTNYKLDGSDFGINPVIETGFTCSEGILSRPTIDPMVIVATPSGAFIGDNGPSAGGIVGMRAPASNIDLSDVVLAGREYRGFDFEDSGSSVLGRDDTVPVWGRRNPDGLGGLIGGEWSDFEGNVESLSTPANIVFVAQASPGVVNATLTDNAGITDMVLMINRINGKYFIYGAQTNTASGMGSNFLVIEQ